MPNIKKQLGIYEPGVHSKDSCWKLKFLGEKHMNGTFFFFFKI